MNALGFTGQIAFDLMVSSKGEVMPIECNPRATSGIHLLSAQQLEKAFLKRSLDSEEIHRPIEGALSRVGLAMWLYGLPSVKFSPRKFQNWWQILRTGQEVIYDGSDPQPFWDQFAALKGLWHKSRQIDGSLLDASTVDIEWNGRQNTHDL